MAIAILVPRLGWSMDEGTFLGWRKDDGDRIKPGDSLFVLESEKASEEIESVDAGILRIPPAGPKPGDRVKVGQVLAYLCTEGEATPLACGEHRAALAAARPTDEPMAAGRRHAFAALESLNSGPNTTRSRNHATQQAISPRARRVGAELGIDWIGVQGSGRNGRIRERDVRAAAAGRSDGRLLPYTNVRGTIAARMLAGATQAAPVTLITRTDATNLVNLHKHFREAAAGADMIVPSHTDLIVKLAAVALRRHPLLQAQWRDAGLFVPNRIDIAIAVDTETGLLVPVVREVDQLTLQQIAARSRELITQARAGQLTADQMCGATFTVTNLGSLGIDAFTPILHLPQCAVLGVGRVVRELAVLDDRIVPRDRMNLCLTFDHRVLDGAPAARFLDTLRGCVEQPDPWLLP